MTLIERDFWIVFKVLQEDRAMHKMHMNNANFAACTMEPSSISAALQRTQIQQRTPRKDTDMAAIEYARVTNGRTGRIVSFLTSALGAVAAWNDARLTRNALIKLSDRELEDIGLIRGDIDDVARSIHY